MRRRGTIATVIVGALGAGMGLLYAFSNRRRKRSVRRWFNLFHVSDMVRKIQPITYQVLRRNRRLIP